MIEPSAERDSPPVAGQKRIRQRRSPVAARIRNWRSASGPGAVTCSSSTVRHVSPSARASSNQPAGQLAGTSTVSVPKGTNVTISLTDPNADQEYHLHGYDIEVTAAKGETGKIQFVADQTGQFDVESHDTEATLLVIVVV